MIVKLDVDLKSKLITLLVMALFRQVDTEMMPPNITNNLVKTKLS